MRQASLCSQCGGSVGQTESVCPWCGVSFLDGGVLMAPTMLEKSLPGHIITELRTALCQVDEFRSNESLRAFFERQSLRPFKNQLPEADSISHRVDFFIAFAIPKMYSSGKEWWNGNTVLSVFLVELFRTHIFDRTPVMESIARIMHL